MNKPTTMSLTEARKNIFDLAEQVQTPGRYFTLTEKGRAKAVLFSADEFDSWRETLEVIQDFPNLLNDIQQAERDYKAGDYVTLQELLSELSTDTATKKKKYGLSALHQQKNQKKSK